MLGTSAVQYLWQYIPASVTELLGQYFLTPEGMLGLFALLPLILFYLFRPEPETRVMPSMTFFMAEEAEGTAQQALKFLQRNWMLIFHILMVVGFAAALSSPYIMQEAEAEQAVFVVDVSASMEPAMDDVRSYIEANTAPENTLILAGERTSIPLEGVSPAAVRNYLEDIAARAVETNIIAGIDRAADYDGAVYLASDLDQTASKQQPGQRLDELQASGRQVDVLDLSGVERNRWGIVDVAIRRGNVTAEVRNVRNSEQTITVSAAGQEKELSVAPGTTQPVWFPITSRAVIRLPDDPVTGDNTVAVSIPDRKNISVVLFRDDRMRFLETAFDLIEGVSFTTVDPPVQTPSAIPGGDVYVLGGAAQYLASTMDELEGRAQQGASVVVMGQDSVFGTAGSFLPVERDGEIKELSTEVQNPARHIVSAYDGYPVNRKAGSTSLATQDQVVQNEVGDGTVVYYGLMQSDFHYDFIYPVFWKRLLQSMQATETIDDLNRETGESLAVPVQRGDGVQQPPVYLDSPGFYNASSIYTASLLSPEETVHRVNGYSSVRQERGQAPWNMRHIVVGVLLFLLMVETLYLYRAGVV